MEADRKRPEGAKIISDSELNLYKMGKRQISTRLVQIHRKTATQDVKAILILREFIAYIEKNFDSGCTFDRPEMMRLEKEYPLRIKRLGWKNWMWEYVLDEKLWRKFAEMMGGECIEFNVHQVLSINLTRFEKLLQEFNS